MVVRIRKKDSNMIKDNQQYFNKLHVLIDALVIIVSYVFAWWLKFLSGILDHEVGVLSFEFYMRGAAAHCSGVYFVVLCVQSVHVQARAGETAGVFQHCDGEYGWTAADVCGSLYP